MVSIVFLSDCVTLGGLMCLFGMVCTSATIPGNIWEEFDNMEGLDVGEG